VSLEPGLVPSASVIRSVEDRLDVLVAPIVAENEHKPELSVTELSSVVLSAALVVDLTCSERVGLALTLRGELADANTLGLAVDRAHGPVQVPSE
jgi:hypothetical protein